MDIKQALAKREELNYELIEAVTSVQVQRISEEIFQLENEIEVATGKTIEELEVEYVV